MVNEPMAQAARVLHPMRSQRWALSDLNPALWPLPALAKVVKANRHSRDADNLFHRAETVLSAAISGSLSFYRDLRDAASESLFFQVYGGLIASGIAASRQGDEEEHAAVDVREMPFVRRSLATIDRGGYAEAVARVAALVGRRPGPISLEDLRFVDETITADKTLSRLSEDDIRRLRGEQLVIAALEPDQAVRTLPALLAGSDERQRVVNMLEEFLSHRDELSSEQKATIKRIKRVLQPARDAPDSENFTLAT